MMKVVALAGGVGGARLVDGLAQCMPPERLTVIVNTGDDFQHLDLHISPDLDTVCYTLAGLANPLTGWGRRSETWHALQSLDELGGPTWFRLGDRDLATHLERTRRLRCGELLSAITRDFCCRWGVQPAVLPATDQYVPTWVSTDEGEMHFQEYFVRRQCQPRVKGFRFEGVEKATPAPGALQAIQDCDLVLICPSNPWVSIAPMLAIPGMREAVAARPVLAVSPIIAGRAVKGPAAKMYAELGLEPSALTVAAHYGDLLHGFILDKQDDELVGEVAALGMRPLTLDTLMKTRPRRKRLAGGILSFAERFLLMGN